MLIHLSLAYCIHFLLVILFFSPLCMLSPLVNNLFSYSVALSLLIFFFRALIIVVQLTCATILAIHMHIWLMPKHINLVFICYTSFTCRCPFVFVAEKDVRTHSEEG